MAYILREKIIMENINHENVIHLYDNFEDNNYYYFVLEYQPNGNLEEIITKYKEN